MKYLKSISIALLFLLIQNHSYGAIKVIRIKSLTSTFKGYSDAEFKSYVSSIMTGDRYRVSTSVKDSAEIDIEVVGTLIPTDKNYTHFILEFDIIDLKHKLKSEHYEGIHYASYSRNIEYEIFEAVSSLKHFYDDEETDSFFMPGASFTFYQPKDASLGFYHGPSAEFVFYSRTKLKFSNSAGPSRIKFYGNIGILNSEFRDSSDLISFGAGVNLSFESKTDRKYLLPYFGVEVGGLAKKDLLTYTFSPVLGCQILSYRKLIWSVQGAYAISSKESNRLSGYQLKTAINFILWK